jgi:hypothetical protein
MIALNAVPRRVCPRASGKTPDRFKRFIIKLAKRPIPSYQSGIPARDMAKTTRVAAWLPPKVIPIMPGVASIAAKAPAVVGLIKFSKTGVIGRTKPKVAAIPGRAELACIQAIEEGAIAYASVLIIHQSVSSYVPQEAVR